MNSEIKKQYGYMTVVEDTEKKYHSTKIYRCRCVCGKIIEVNIDKLHSGHVKSCGCRKFRWRNHTGQKFGRLTVLEFAYAKNRKSYWKCRCDCRNVCFVSTSQLATGETVSCGCKNDENRANIPHLDRGLSAESRPTESSTETTRRASGAFISIGSEDYGGSKSCSSTRPISWAGSSIKGMPSTQGKKKYFGKYRN